MDRPALRDLMRTWLDERRHDESGFTLLELLVVFLLIGILVAIALPALGGQKVKAQDATAKTEVRNAVSQVEACFSQRRTYAGCQPAIDRAGIGGVRLDAATATSYTVTATSPSRNRFQIIRAPNGAVTRNCIVGGRDAGGCPDGTGSSW